MIVCRGKAQNSSYKFSLAAIKRNWLTDLHLVVYVFYPNYEPRKTFLHHISSLNNNSTINSVENNFGKLLKENSQIVADIIRKLCKSLNFQKRNCNYDFEQQMGKIRNS